MAVATRLKNANLTEKDPEAESLIQHEIGAQKDSSYVLTQAVIIQEQALKEAQARMGALEKQLEQARRQGGESASQGKSRFLGGGFGGSSTSPPFSARRTDGPPSVQATGQAERSGSGFGDFMKSAASVALGVAGGQLLFSGLSNMFGAGEAAAEPLSETVAPDVNEESVAESDVEQNYEDPFDVAQHEYDEFDAPPEDDFHSVDEPDFPDEFDAGEEDFF
jgi:hypothetical protein